MKLIGIDCRMVNESGIGRYITNIVQVLAKDDLVNHYKLYFFDEESAKKFQLPSNFSYEVSPYKWHTFSEQISFYLQINKHNFDIFHFPQTNYPILYASNFVITVHDLTMIKHSTGKASTLFYPFYFTKLLVFKLILYFALNRSKKIITVSEFVKNEISAKYKINPSKIETIYNGVSSTLTFKPKPLSFFENFNISKPFIFYIGNAYPHKNLETLILAFTAFNHENKYNLVLAGKSDFFYEKLKNKYQDLKNIVFVGGLSDDELSSFYSSCEMFIYPSISEGFGIQIIEALSLGCKVCCSNNTSFPEIAGNNAIYFNPFDLEDIIKSMNSCLSNGKKLNTFEQKQLLDKFNWKNSAHSHLRIYEA